MRWNQHIAQAPDFNRMPYRSVENAIYRDDVPEHLLSNPYYRAVPGYRSVPDVMGIIEARNRKLPSDIRSMPYLLRKEYVDSVDSAIFPLRRHVALEEMILATIRNSYVNRPLYFENAVEDCARISVNPQATTPCRSANYAEGSVGSGALFGDPGEGKTVSLKRILMSCPQIIEHRKFEGKDLNVTQLTWLYISLPPKASTLALLVWITATLDFLLGTTYLEILKVQSNLTLKARCVAQWLTLHAVGTIVCDELQNIKAGSQHERLLLENTLQELINYTYTRWVFVGTESSRSAIMSGALRRRLIGERGQKLWKPLDGSDWDDFISDLWEWQVTAQPTDLTDELKALLHRLSGGVPDYAKRIFTGAQSLLIASKTQDERLTPHIFESVMSTLPDVAEKMHRKATRDARKRRLNRTR